jgi:TonB family protein
MRTFPPLAIVFLALAGPIAAQDAPGPLRAVPPPAPPPPVLSTPPVPVTNPDSWVTPDDYPKWAVAHEVDGRVRFTVDIDEHGGVTRCEIQDSSGVPDLDAMACEKVTERARFRPARDQGGNPVAGQWSSSVLWQIPEEVAEAVPQPGELVVSLVVERDGTVSDCTVERAEGVASQAVVGELCAEAGSFEPILDDRGRPERRRIRLTTRIEHEPLP